MLNTQTQLGAFFVWVVIVSICLWSAWSVFGIASPWFLWRRAFDSELAADLKGFQTLIGLPLGVLTLWIAFYLNRKLEIDKEVIRRDAVARDLGHAISLELLDVAAECDFKIRNVLEELDQIDSPVGEVRLNRAFKEVLRIQEMLVSTLSPERLVIMGFNAYGASRMLRNNLRFLNFWIERAPEGAIPVAELGGYFATVMNSYAELGLECRRSQKLFLDLADLGVDVANRRRMPSPAKRAEIDSHIAHVRTEYHALRQRQLRRT